MFMILALLALASAFDMSRHNRSVVVFDQKLPRVYKVPSPVANKTVPAQPVPQPAPAPKSLRH
jgi:hypothetical protein